MIPSRKRKSRTTIYREVRRRVEEDLRGEGTTSSVSGTNSVHSEDEPINHNFANSDDEGSKVSNDPLPNSSTIMCGDSDSSFSNCSWDSSNSRNLHNFSSFSFDSFNASDSELPDSSDDSSSCGSHCSSHYDSICGSISDADDNPLPMPAAPPIEDPPSITEALRNWSSVNNISNLAFGKLIIALQPFFPSLPKDPRTILGTSGSNVSGMEEMDGGDYHYFGLKNTLLQIVQASKPSSNILWLSFNVDGLSLFKDTNEQLWPILCKVIDSKIPPLPVSAWYGHVHASLDNYFKDFVPELKELLQNGFEAEGEQYSVRIHSFVCDAPATAYVKGIKLHSGSHGCGKCVQRGVWLGRMTYPLMNSPLRTDETFRARTHKKHHKELSPLTDVGFGMISCFPHDYLHLICEGVVKRTFDWLLNGAKNVKRPEISAETAERISRRIRILKKWWPRDFSRKPRPLSAFGRYKATELRSLLLYLAGVVLKRTNLRIEYYKHFLKLHAAITILCREDLQHRIDDADAMLREFVAESKVLYGPEFVVYNVHNLLHLANDCRKFGKLDNFSAFQYENELHVIKNMVKGRSKPLQELVNRLRIRYKIKSLKSRAITLDDGFVRKSSWSKGPTTGLLGYSFSKFNINGRTISTLQGDNALFLSNNSVVLASNFIETKNGDFVVGKRFLRYTDFYVDPIPSSELGIYQADKLSNHFKKWPISMIKSKAMVLPLKSRGNFVVYPLCN